MKVLQVLPSVVPGGGAEQSLVMVAPALREAGIVVHLAVLTDRQALVGRIERAGVIVHDLSAHRSTWSRARALRRLVRRIEPALVHSTLYEADIPTRLGTLGTGVPLLTTWASTTYSFTRRSLEPGIAPWKRDVVRAIDAATSLISRSSFHAVTEGVADDGIAALHVPANRVTVVERGRDPQRFTVRDESARRDARSRLGLPEDASMIVTVARQAHQKGHVHLLRAFDQVAASVSTAVLYLVGPQGTASASIATELSAIRHGDRVVDLGERSDIADLLAAADVFVLASVAEGAAGALIEAMAVGTPIVVTDIEGLKGVVEQDITALLATPGDPDDLARQLRASIDDDAASAQRARAARTVFEQRFSIDESAARLARLYRSLGAATR